VSIYKLDEEAQKRCMIQSSLLNKNLTTEFFSQLANEKGDWKKTVELSSIFFNGILFTLRDFIESNPDEQRQHETVEHVYKFLKGEFDRID